MLYLFTRISLISVFSECIFTSSTLSFFLVHPCFFSRASLSFLFSLSFTFLLKPTTSFIVRLVFWYFYFLLGALFFFFSSFSYFITLFFFHVFCVLFFVFCSFSFFHLVFTFHPLQHLHLLLFLIVIFLLLVLLVPLVLLVLLVPPCMKYSASHFPPLSLLLSP